MNQKQILKLSHDILTAKVAKVNRTALINVAVKKGRKESAAKKASTMRLTMWSRGKKSSI